MEATSIKETLTEEELEQRLFYRQGHNLFNEWLKSQQKTP